MIARVHCFLSRMYVVSLLLWSTTASAATLTGTVTDGTNNKPSAGDSVALIDVQSGMAAVASATTDSHGHYSIDSPGMGTYLVRVNHQGGTYFIAAPQPGQSGDVTVYDVAAKVDGVSIDADMILVEAAGDMLRVQERYLVRNTSLPPRAQFSNKTFEVVLPPNAELDGAAATRPGGLATNTELTPMGQPQHYTFNIPIQPDRGQQETMFQLQYHLPYGGRYTFKPRLVMPADNLVVYVPKNMKFVGDGGTSFQATQEDPRVQTFIAKNVSPGAAVAFTVSGQGQMPRDPQSNAGPSAGAMVDAGVGSRPGGGIGAPIDTPDPLTRYKWWMIAGIMVLLIAGAGYMLRNHRPTLPGTIGTQTDNVLLESHEEPRPHIQPGIPIRQESFQRPDASDILLNHIKEELFAIESEKLTGTLSESEYSEVKAGLQAVLKRAMKARGKTGTA